MTIDITIGKRAVSPPLFRCAVAGVCAGDTCQECLHLVKQERRDEAPPITTATAQGPKRGGFNFHGGIPTGYYFRWLEETRIHARYPWFNIPSNDPITFCIPDTLPGYLHKLAVEIELGIVATSNPTQDAEFTCWMAWWAGAALKSYGLQAAFLFS